MYEISYNVNDYLYYHDLRCNYPQYITSIRLLIDGKPIDEIPSNLFPVLQKIYGMSDVSIPFQILKEGINSSFILQFHTKKDKNLTFTMEKKYDRRSTPICQIVQSQRIQLYPKQASTAIKFIYPITHFIFNHDLTWIELSLNGQKIVLRKTDTISDHYIYSFIDRDPTLAIDFTNITTKEISTKINSPITITIYAICYQKYHDNNNQDLSN
jgi:hypothetical protein